MLIKGHVRIVKLNFNNKNKDIDRDTEQKKELCITLSHYSETFKALK